jgi:hypothetical protein
VKAKARLKRPCSVSSSAPATMSTIAAARDFGELLDRGGALAGPQGARPSPEGG